MSKLELRCVANIAKCGGSVIAEDSESTATTMSDSDVLIEVCVDSVESAQA